MPSERPQKREHCVCVPPFPRDRDETTIKMDDSSFSCFSSSSSPSPTTATTTLRLALLCSHGTAREWEAAQVIVSRERQCTRRPPILSAFNRLWLYWTLPRHRVLLCCVFLVFFFLLVLSISRSLQRLSTRLTLESSTTAHTYRRDSLLLGPFPD